MPFDINKRYVFHVLSYDMLLVFSCITWRWSMKAPPEAKLFGKSNKSHARPFLGYVIVSLFRTWARLHEDYTHGIQGHTGLLH